MSVESSAMRRFLALLIAAFAMNSVFAAEAGEAGLVNWLDWMKVMLSLIGIIVLILFLARGVKQWDMQARKTPAVFQVLSVISLGGKDKIYLVKVGDEQLVVGSSLAGLSMLHLMQKNIDIAEIEQARAATGTPAKFADVLRQMGRGWHQ